MKKITIYLSGNQDKLGNYIYAIKKIGCEPIFDSTQKADALILCGGGDVSPCLFNKPFNLAFDVDLQRDCQELFLIAHFISKNKPILGICRGMQILNVHFGGTLKENVQNLELHSRQNQTFDKHHLVLSKANSFCQKIYGNAFTANSAHHQSVEHLGSCLTASAYSIDNELEAFETKNIFAVQFHPERMTDEKSSSGIKIFEHFKNAIDK